MIKIICFILLNIGDVLLLNVINGNVKSFILYIKKIIFYFI